MKQLHAIVIGVGNMGQNHVRVLQRLPDVSVIAVVDSNADRASAVAERFGVPYAYADLDACLAEQKADIASIAVHPDVCPEVAMQVIDAGIHVLVEKPVALTIAELKRLANRAEKRRVTVGVGYTEHFNPAVRIACQVVKKGVLGTVRYIRAQRIGVPTPRMGSLNAILDIGVHDIEVFNAILRSKPTRVQAAGRSVFGPTVDIATVTLEYPNALAQVELNKIAPFKKRTLEIFGTRGLLQVDYMLQSATYFPRQEVEKSESFDQLLLGYGMRPQSVGIDVAFQEPLQLEMEDFVTAIRKRKAPQVTLKDAIAILETALRATKALG